MVPFCAKHRAMAGALGSRWGWARAPNGWPTAGGGAMVKNPGASSENRMRRPPGYTAAEPGVAPEVEPGEMVIAEESVLVFSGAGDL